MPAGCGECRDCKRVREHVASVLPIRVLEAAGEKPLRISGVAMAAGISRNFNVYTPQELQAFADKLVGAPVYMEHVSASTATGKVVKSAYDSASRVITYEAEIFDQAVAEKIRNGLIRHVSVGADYEAVDVVDAKVYRGLYDPELSLIAVPGIPETTINVLEGLAHVHTGVPASGKDHKPVKVIHERLEKVAVKELLSDLNCVFCGRLGEYLVSVCTSCGDNAQSLVLGPLERLPVCEAKGDLPSSFTAFKVKFVAGSGACEECMALDGKTFIYGTEPQPHPGCKCPGYQVVERLLVHGNFKGVESLEEKDAVLIAEKVAAKLGGASSREVEELKEKLRVAEQEGDAVEAQIARSQQFGIGVKKGGNISKPSEFAGVADEDFADPVNYRYPVDKDHVQAALSYFNVPENRSDYSAEEQAKILQKIVSSAVAAGVEVKYQAGDAVYKALPEELKVKLAGYSKEASAEEKLAAKESELRTVREQLERVKALVPGVDLLADPPVLMPVSEAVRLVEGVLPSGVVEHSWGFGPQRLCQELRRVTAHLKAKGGGA